MRFWNEIGRIVKSGGTAIRRAFRPEVNRLEAREVLSTFALPVADAREMANLATNDRSFFLSKITTGSQSSQVASTAATRSIALAPTVARVSTARTVSPVAASVSNVPITTGTSAVGIPSITSVPVAGNLLGINLNTMTPTPTGSSASSNGLTFDNGLGFFGDGFTTLGGVNTPGIPQTGSLLGTGFNIFNNPALINSTVISSGPAATNRLGFTNGLTTLGGVNNGGAPLSGTFLGNGFTVNNAGVPLAGSFLGTDFTSSEVPTLLNTSTAANSGTLGFTSGLGFTGGTNQLAATDAATNGLAFTDGLGFSSTTPTNTASIVGVQPVVSSFSTPVTTSLGTVLPTISNPAPNTTTTGMMFNSGLGFI